VLGYLLTHRRRQVSRLELAETVWSRREREYARRCLSTALWRLKRSTGPGTPLVAFHGSDDVSFNWSAATWVDSIALEMRVGPLLKHPPAALSRAELTRLERGTRLYRGPYLIGMDDEWALLERHRLHSLYCDGLHLLMLAHASRSQWHAALEWGRSLSREEPLREDVHRLLMLAYANSGNRASALSLYKECERRLAAELGIEPMEETRELYRRIARSAVAPALAEVQDARAASEVTVSHAASATTASAASVPTTSPPAVTTAPTVAIASAKHRIARVKRALTASQHQLDKAVEGLDSTGAAGR
jgi:DNA-binding SARP family transcriptional activator